MASPTCSLPTEILAHILFLASCHCKRDPPYESIPLTLSPVVSSAVCKHWRQITVNHQFLWTHLDLVIDVMNPNGKYYASKIWIERSKGALISVHVHQPRFHRDDYYAAGGEESLSLVFTNTERPPAPMVSRLIRFLIPLMPQVYSLTTALTGPWRSTLTTIIDNWTKHGTIGQARVLKTLTNPEFSELEIYSSRTCRSFLESLRVLHLHNTIVSWPEFSFSNLIELEIEMGDGSFAITLHELASIMTSCPKLQHLALGQLIFTEDASEQPKPVLLGELRELRVADLQTYEGRADIFKAVLDLINPGQNALSVEMSLLWVTGSSQRALDAVCSFVERSNVSKLHVRGGPVSGGWEDNPYFASQFGPLPRVRTLILEEFCFCDVVRVESHMSNFDDDDWINTYHNPRPINSELVPWPDVRNLYLRRCIIEKEYLYHLLLPRTVHTLYLRECSNNLKAGQDPDSDLGASFKSQRSMEDCVQLLSQAGLKVVDSPTWDVSWPSFIL